VNGNYVPPPYTYSTGKDKTIYSLRGLIGTISVNIPESFLKNGESGLISVSYPFLPANWTSTYLLRSRNSDYKITRLSGKKIFLHTSDPMGFDKDFNKTPTAEDGKPPSSDTRYKPDLGFCWRLIIGEHDPIPIEIKGVCELAGEKDGSEGPGAGSSKSPEVQRRNSSDKGTSASQSKSKQAAEKPPTQVLPPAKIPGHSVINSVLITLSSDIPDKIILISPNGEIFNLDVPKLTQPPPEAPKPLEIKQFGTALIEIPVNDASAVALVRVSGTDYKPFPQESSDGKPAKKVRFEITREITKKPGDVELILLDKSGNPVGKTTLLRIACVENCP
jgi:hypothetical protein